MPDAVARLNTALEGRYQIDRELASRWAASIFMFHVLYWFAIYSVNQVVDGGPSLSRRTFVSMVGSHFYCSPPIS